MTANRRTEMRAEVERLRQENQSLLDRAQAESRSLTDEEAQTFDANLAQMERLNADIERWDRQELASARAARREGLPIPDGATISGLHNRAADQPFSCLGEQLHAIAQATLNRDPLARERLMAVAQGASEAVDSDGGFLLQDDFAAGIEARMRQTGQVFGLVTPIEVSGAALVERQIDETSRADGQRAGGVQGYWVDEAESIPASRPKFRKLRTELQKVAALGYSTDELLDDFVAMSSIFEQEFADELLFKVEDAIIEGDGAGKPLGIIHANNPSLIVVAKESGQSADTILTKNISKMWQRLPVRSRATAVWFINQDVEPQLDELAIIVGTTGVLEPRFVTYDQQGALRIKGRPVVAIEYASTLGDQGDIILADMTQYRLIRKGGVRQASSMHVAFTTDEMAFRATYRIGGQPRWKSALTPFKGSNTISPFITLAERA